MYENNVIPYPFVVDASQFTEGGAWTEASSFLAAETFVWVRGRASDMAPPWLLLAQKLAMTAAMATQERIRAAMARVLELPPPSAGLALTVEVDAALGVEADAALVAKADELA